MREKISPTDSFGFPAIAKIIDAYNNDELSIQDVAELLGPELGTIPPEENHGELGGCA